MSALIVDFPRFRRNSYADARLEDKTVRFVSATEVQFYQQPDASDASKLYFSKDEYKAMRDARARDVQAVNRQYLLMSSGTSTQPADLDFTGLENILTKELTRKLLFRREQVSRAVLIEQRRQDVFGESNPDKIAAASQEVSKHSEQRAVKVAWCTAAELKR